MNGDDDGERRHRLATASDGDRRSTRTATDERRRRANERVGRPKVLFSEGFDRLRVLSEVWSLREVLRIKSGVVCVGGEKENRSFYLFIYSYFLFVFLILT